LSNYQHGTKTDATKMKARTVIFLSFAQVLSVEDMKQFEYAAERRATPQAA